MMLHMTSVLFLFHALHLEYMHEVWKAIQAPRHRADTTNTADSRLEQGVHFPHVKSTMPASVLEHMMLNITRSQNIQWLIAWF